MSEKWMPLQAPSYFKTRDPAALAALDKVRMVARIDVLVYQCVHLACFLNTNQFAVYQVQAAFLGVRVFPPPAAGAYVFASIRRGVTPEINAIATMVLVASLILILIARFLMREKTTTN